MLHVKGGWLLVRQVGSSAISFLYAGEKQLKNLVSVCIYYVRQCQEEDDVVFKQAKSNCHCDPGFVNIFEQLDGCLVGTCTAHCGLSKCRLIPPVAGASMNWLSRTSLVPTTSTSLAHLANS